MKRIVIFFSALMIVPVFLFSQVVVQKNDTINRTSNKDQKIGYWEEQMGDQIAKGFYKDNLRTGCWVTVTTNNLLSRIDNYSYGKKEGISIAFDRRNRILLTEYYKNGVLDGQAINYSSYNEYPLTEINYSKGKKNGPSKIFYDNGKLQEDATYKEDLKDGVARWFNRTGKLMAEYHYENGMFEGAQKTFYENDTLQSIATYLHNLYSGPYIEYYRNGRMKISGQYLNNLKEGEWIEFDETGKAITKTKYKNGVAK